MSGDDTPAGDLDEAERILRAFVRDERPSTGVQMLRREASALLAEYDRRGKVEQAAAAYVMGGLCGNYSIEGEGPRWRQQAFSALLGAVRTNGEFRG